MMTGARPATPLAGQQVLWLLARTIVATGGLPWTLGYVHCVTG